MPINIHYLPIQYDLDVLEPRMNERWILKYNLVKAEKHFKQKELIAMHILHEISRHNTYVQCNTIVIILIQSYITWLHIIT